MPKLPEHTAARPVGCQCRCHGSQGWTWRCKDPERLCQSGGPSQFSPHPSSAALYSHCLPPLLITFGPLCPGGGGLNSWGGASSPARVELGPGVSFCGCPGKGGRTLYGQAQNRPLSIWGNESLWAPGVWMAMKWRVERSWLVGTARWAGVLFVQGRKRGTPESGLQFPHVTREREGRPAFPPPNEGLEEGPAPFPASSPCPPRPPPSTTDRLAGAFQGGSCGSPWQQRLARGPSGPWRKAGRAPGPRPPPHGSPAWGSVNARSRPGRPRVAAGL